MSVPVSDLQSIAPSAIIELFQLELNAAQHGVNETYYFHAGTDATGSNDDIVWDGQAYLAFPIEATEFEYTGTGSLPRPKLRVSNIYGTITGLILSLPNGLEGAKVTRIRTLARYIDGVNFPGGTNPLGTPDPTAEFPREIYYIDRKASENRDLIEFELAAAFDLVGVRAPKRQCVANVCQWIYRGPECGYAGNAFFNFNDVPVAAIGQDVCGKRLRSCELRFSQLRFPGNVVNGSNVIALDQSASLSTGDPVTGFGIPAGTTVASVSNNLVTVSQNATITSSAVTTGTIQSNFTQIIVASATNIAPGMNVTGTYLSPNTQVVAVAGTTITLSSPADFSQFTTVVGSFTAVYGDTNVVEMAAGESGAVGQFVSNITYLPLSRGALITQIGHYWWTTNGVNTQYKYYVLSKYLDSDFDGNTVFSLHQMGSISSATYTFTVTDRNYTFRDAATIPYGSYPGIGAFTT